MDQLKALYEQFKPKRWYSWQTAIWLSGISALMSSLANLLSGRPYSFVANLIASIGWFFLIAGISWAVKEAGSRFAPWITGVVFCIFFFGNLRIDNWKLAVLIWPIVSAFIFALPYFWDQSLKKKIPDMNDRITILFVIGSQLLCSFWILFFFVLSDFIKEYPSFYSDDLSESLFIVRAPSRRTQEPRGVFIFDFLDVELVDHYQNRLWAEVEAELVSDPALTVNALLQKVNRKIPTLKEDDFWTLTTPAIFPKDQGLNLVLQYQWTGAKARIDDDYLIEKTCNLKPMVDSSGEKRGEFTAIACQPSEVKGWLNSGLD